MIVAVVIAFVDVDDDEFATTRRFGDATRCALSLVGIAARCAVSFVDVDATACDMRDRVRVAIVYSLSASRASTSDNYVKTSCLVLL